MAPMFRSTHECLRISPKKDHPMLQSLEPAVDKGGRSDTFAALFLK
jgi:hypothetical protein